VSILRGRTHGDSEAATSEDRASTRATQLKLLSLLLQYPTADLAEHEPEVNALVHAMPACALTGALATFLDAWHGMGLLALQQEYVRAFDFQKRVSLHLTYYQYGDQRQRGLALVRLKRAYAAAGLPLCEGETSDYLPAVLEFAALAPAGYDAVLLKEHRVAIEMLRLGLKEDSIYRSLVDGLCSILPRLSHEDREAVCSLLAGGPPTEQVGLEPFAPPEVMPESVSGGRR
jgi:nitrate reductase delta subunit